MSVYDQYAPTFTPAAQALETDRVSFLRRVAGMLALGLTITGASTLVSILIINTFSLSAAGYMGLFLILGPFLFANYVCRTMVFSPSQATKWTGFIAAAIAEGWTFGFLMTAAVAVSSSVYGNGFGIIVQGVGLTGLTVLGMVAYLLTGPRDLGYIKSFLAIAMIPMFIGMVVWFAFPSLFGGAIGILLNLVFVGVSAAGLLVNLNKTMHELDTRMHIEGGYLVLMGVLVLMWNIITLLMRLANRD